MIGVSRTDVQWDSTSGRQTEILAALAALGRRRATRWPCGVAPERALAALERRGAVRWPCWGGAGPCAGGAGVTPGRG